MEVSLRLPYELILLIMECTYFCRSIRQASIRDWAPDRETLSSCALVCRSWRHPAQRFLFHEMNQTNASFMNAIRSSNGRAFTLGSSIRRLKLHIHVASSYKSNHDQYFDVNDFLTLIPACTRLYELTLRIDGLHAFDKDIMDRLRSSSHQSVLAPIAALHLVSFGTQSPIPYQLLSVMSGVHYLRLGTELAAPHPKQPCTIKLYELALFRVPSNVRNVDWLLSASQGNLRILEFRDTPGRSYDSLLSKHGPHVQSFRILRQELRSASIFKLCPNLKELVIYQFSDFIPIQNIPTGVEHLSFRYSVWAENNTLMPIVHAVELLPHLRLLSCNMETQKHAHFGILQKACDEKDIQLRVDAPPIFILDDPVPLRDVPRWKSVRNLPLMQPAHTRSKAGN